MGSSYESEQNAKSTLFPKAAFCVPLSQVIESQQSCNMKPAHPAADGDSTQSYQIVKPAPWKSNRSHYQLPLTLQSENTTGYSKNSVRDLNASSASGNTSSHSRLYQNSPALAKSNTQENNKKHANLSKISFDLPVSQVSGSHMFNHFNRPSSLQQSQNSLFSEAGSQCLNVPPAPSINVNNRGSILSFGESQHRQVFTKPNRMDNKQFPCTAREPSFSSQYEHDETMKTSGTDKYL